RDEDRFGRLVHVKQCRDVVVVFGPARDGLLLFGGQIEDVDGGIVTARVELAAGEIGTHRVEGGGVFVTGAGFGLGRIDDCHGEYSCSRLNDLRTRKQIWLATPGRPEWAC